MRMCYAGQIEKAETVHHIVNSRTDKSQALLETNLIHVAVHTAILYMLHTTNPEADKESNTSFVMNVCGR